MNLTDDQIVWVIKNDLKDLNQAIQFLYTANYPAVKGFITSNGGNEAKAANIFQEALVTLYIKIRKGDFDQSEPISLYLLSTSKDMWLRESAKEVSKSLDEDLKNLARSKDLMLQESQDSIRQFLDQIGGECKDLLLDFYFGKVSIEELKQKFELENDKAVEDKKYGCMQKLIRLIQNKKNQE